MGLGVKQVGKWQGGKRIFHRKAPGIRVSAFGKELPERMLGYTFIT